LSRPTEGSTGGIRGWFFSKKSMGDFTGSNFEGAHHLFTRNKEPYKQSMKNLSHNKNNQKRCRIGTEKKL
jgi:hypothetical protein